jgi:hypothetical protein
MSRTYNSLDFQYSQAGFDYTGRTTLSRTGTDSGSGTESAAVNFFSIISVSGNDTANSNELADWSYVRYGTGTDAGLGGDSGSIVFVSRSAEGTDVALSSETGVGLRTVVRDNQEGNGFGTETADALRTTFASSVDAASGAETASRLRIVLRTATDTTATGGSATTAIEILYRTGADTASSSEVASRVHVHLRSATDVGAGTLDVALWVNAGKTLNREVRMPPFWVDKKPKLIRR